MHFYAWKPERRPHPLRLRRTAPSWHQLELHIKSAGFELLLLCGHESARHILMTSPAVAAAAKTSTNSSTREGKDIDIARVHGNIPDHFRPLGPWYILAEIGKTLRVHGNPLDASSRNQTERTCLELRIFTAAAAEWFCL